MSTTNGVLQGVSLEAMIETSMGRGAAQSSHAFASPNRFSTCAFLRKVASSWAHRHGVENATAFQEQMWSNRSTKRNGTSPDIERKIFMKEAWEKCAMQLGYEMDSKTLLAVQICLDLGWFRYLWS